MNKSTLNVEAKPSQTAPAVSKALARVLGATESKENEAEAKYQNTGSENRTEDKNAAGKRICNAEQNTEAYYLQSISVMDTKK